MMARLVPEACISVPLLGKNLDESGIIAETEISSAVCSCLGKVRRRDLSRMKLSHVFIPLSNDRTCLRWSPSLDSRGQTSGGRTAASVFIFTKCETFALLGNPIGAALQRSRGERLCDVRAWILSRSAFCKSWLIGASNGRREACCHLPAS